MKILMMTNTYKPLLGGLEKSIESFAYQFRCHGHRVIIVAPEYPEMVEEKDVIRVPAVENFNGSQFSVPFPIHNILIEALGDFHPDIIHAHHPFLIGDTALRIASKYNVPVIFTHHTLYEENVHYIPGNDEVLKRFVIELSTGYANLADKVFAPSESVMNMLQARGVVSPIEIVPTGIDVKKFIRGAKKGFRKKYSIPVDGFVIGHIGRLAPEKNLEFLIKVVTRFLQKYTNAHFLIAGKGPSQEIIEQIAIQGGVQNRVHLIGVVTGKDLVDAYHAMDVFVFASQSETQGLVLTEAMAAGVAVIAVDAPGVREVVINNVNGRLLENENEDDFISALQWFYQQSPEKLKKIKKACHKTARKFSMDIIAKKVLNIYVSLMVDGFVRRPAEESFWSKTLRLIQAQWGLVKNLTKATGAMINASNENILLKKQ